MEIERIIDIVKEVYINVYGLKKWNGLSDTEKHDVAMIMVKDMLTMIDKISGLATAPVNAAAHLGAGLKP